MAAAPKGAAKGAKQVSDLLDSTRPPADQDAPFPGDLPAQVAGLVSTAA